MLQKSLDEVDPKLLETFSKLGIPISEQKRLAGVKDVAYDYVFDSESIATTFKKELAAQGIIFCSISEAVREYPDLVKKHLGSVVSCLTSQMQCQQPLCDPQLDQSMCSWNGDGQMSAYLFWSEQVGPDWILSVHIAGQLERPLTCRFRWGTTTMQP